jgi:hypothetical protein
MSTSVTSKHTVEGFAAYLRLKDGTSRMTDYTRFSEREPDGREKVWYGPTNDQWLSINPQPQNSQNRSIPWNEHRRDVPLETMVPSATNPCTIIFGGLYLGGENPYFGPDVRSALGKEVHDAGGAVGHTILHSMEFGGMVAPFSDEPETHEDVVDPGPQIHAVKYCFESVPASQNCDLPPPSLVERAQIFGAKLAKFAGGASQGN